MENTKLPPWPISDGKNIGEQAEANQSGNSPIVQKEPTGAEVPLGHIAESTEARKAEGRDAENLRYAGARIQQKDAGQCKSG